MILFVLRVLLYWDEMKTKIMKFPEETIFVKTDPKLVIKHLKSVERRIIKTSPATLCLKTGTGNKSENLYLHRNNGVSERYRVRRTFLYKLLKWYSFPVHLLPRLSTETIVSAANDFLLNIYSPYVIVKLENDEALTITSEKYTDIPDLDILEMCSDAGISEVSRDDFCMRIYSEEECRVAPVPGDDCGFGFNLFNSETGFMALKISHYILRYICSNGAVAAVNRGNRTLIHYNLNRNEVFDYIKSSIKKIGESREQIINKLKLLNQSRADKKTIDAAGRRLSGMLGYQETHKLMKVYEENTISKFEGFDSTKYALFNFITSSAKGYDIHIRARMEEIAGDLFL